MNEPSRLITEVVVMRRKRAAHQAKLKAKKEKSDA